MSKKIHPWIPDEELVDYFKKFFGKISNKNKQYFGEMLQKSMKLILTFYGDDKYKFDPEVEQLWNVYSDITGIPHTKDQEINMIKAIDNTPVKLRNKKERAYAAMYLLMMEADEIFTIEEFTKFVNELGYGNRTVKGYLELLGRRKEIIRINDTKYKFRDMSAVIKFMHKNIYDEHVRNEILVLAVKESRKIKAGV